MPKLIHIQQPQTPPLDRYRKSWITWCNQRAEEDELKSPDRKPTCEICIAQQKAYEDCEP